MSAPDPTVAVLGGGQLGRMLGLAAIPLGLRFRFLDPAEGPPAAAVGSVITAELDDLLAVDRLVDGAAVCTYEWEGVAATTAAHAAGRVPVHPTPRALEVAQDRLVEKETMREIGIRVADFVAVDDAGGLRRALDTIGLPAVLKTRRGGYDGKGQVVLRAPADVDAALATVGSAASILETFVPFRREVSVVAVRSRHGEVRVWPLAENVHAGGILRESRAPAPADAAVLAQAETHITKLLDALDYVGVLALECFEVDGELVGNEVAPRVHNSAHWTIEGAVTSQFENHVRAVVGLPLGGTEARGHAAMLNAIGALPERAAVLAVPGAHLHDYGKEPRRARKVGHVTVVADDVADLDARLALLRPIVAAATEG